LRVFADRFLGVVARVFFVAPRDFLALAFGRDLFGPAVRVPVFRFAATGITSASWSCPDDLFDATCTRAGAVRVYASA
jgi:hypothetical protein